MTDQTVCRRRICTEDSNGEPFCSERCERMHRPKPRPRTTAEREALAHKEARNRSRLINNVVNQE